MTFDEALSACKNLRDKHKLNFQPQQIDGVWLIQFRERRLSSGWPSEAAFEEYIREREAGYDL